MATTSLSRQLAALRAPSTSVRIPSGVDAASALSILDPGEAVDIKVGIPVPLGLDMGKFVQSGTQIILKIYTTKSL